MRKRILASLCLLALTAPVVAADVKPEQIAGRWSGATYGMKSGARITLDIVACGSAWCGIKVEADDKCGATALKLDSVQPLGGPQSDSLQFNGTLELMPGTEPYTVQAWLIPRPDNGVLALQITGDTGGEYRAYRRTFPFEAQLARVKDAVCHAPATVSSLD
jgi:hypothetical protein